jgi:protein subunit release factor A
MEHVLKYMTIKWEKNTEELLANVKGIETLFQKQEKKEFVSNVVETEEDDVDDTQDDEIEEKKLDNKEFNEKLQKTLSKSVDDDDDNIEL